MINQAFIFNSSKPIIEAIRSMLDKRNPPQHDHHVINLRSFMRAYGSMEGYHLYQARKAASRARLMATEDGRDYIDRVAMMNKEWSNG